jgi:hypothetical protein
MRHCGHVQALDRLGYWAAGYTQQFRQTNRPSLAWVLARATLRFAQRAGIILPAHQSKSGNGDGFVSRLLHLMQFRHIQR